MIGALWRNVSLHARNILFLSTNGPNPTRSLVPISASNRSRLSFFSSGIANSSTTPHKDVSNDDVSNEELKRRVDKYLEGDEEAIPSIFEAILKRKLAKLEGKHDGDENDDDEMMEQLCGNKQIELESDVEEDKEW